MRLRPHCNSGACLSRIRPPKYQQFASLSNDCFASRNRMEVGKASLSFELRNAIVLSPGMLPIPEYTLLTRTDCSRRPLSSKHCLKFTSRCDDFAVMRRSEPVSYTHLRAHETRHDLVCR